MRRESAIVAMERMIAGLARLTFGKNNPNTVKKAPRTVRVYCLSKMTRMLGGVGFGRALK